MLETNIFGFDSGYSGDVVSYFTIVLLLNQNKILNRLYFLRIKFV